ncbi:hypothetical protein RCH16_003421 [Cryobacterium sp. MP_M5]|nr:MULTISPECIES: hypothetical protein [unclassified Cryobacterium]MBG6059964.1 hypothetical protein [Cryobacterium sp. MP_M3]MEC5178382.1 hypothetical protein [Cryobacterium sp. MP_M5]
MSDNQTPEAQSASNVSSPPERPNVDATMQVLYASDPSMLEKRVE